ncbi:alpha/beta hydrolase [Nocardia salmonicida]|uniref:alpha/beta hydrolase n=1 Tax=Nocardia salmonicida TaxID=53431 RepID=UPI0036729425
MGIFNRRNSRKAQPADEDIESEIQSISIEPLAPGIALFGALFRRLMNSISSMTPQQVEKIQDTDPTKRANRVLLPAVFGRIRRGVTKIDHAIPGPNGEIVIRVYTPKTIGDLKTRPIVVNFHGGGWVLGNISSNDWICSNIALDVDSIVVSVDYRLAPANKFPAALEDCYAALVWTANNAAALGGDPKRIGIIGESAGGNLAASVSLLVRERTGPPLIHQTLIYPVTDAAQDTSSYQVNSNAIILSSADMAAFYEHYLPTEQDPFDWRISPLRASDHSGLPPAYIIVAGHDPLRDEGLMYAQALKKSGVEVTVAHHGKMPHGFMSFPYFSRDADSARKAIIKWQKEIVESCENESNTPEGR